jgi:shikimate kinase
LAKVVASGQPIALVGMPGGGKSTVGRHLARRIGLPFTDADAVIEARLGTSIRSFFELQGEDAFRDVEAQVVDELTLGPRAVIATGGGAVLREANRRMLRERSTVIYLRSAPEDLARRMRHDTQRPLLQVADPLAKLRDMYALRDPLYRETAHFIVDTGKPSVPMLVNRVLMQLELAGLVLEHRSDEPPDPDRPPRPS